MTDAAEKADSRQQAEPYSCLLICVQGVQKKKCLIIYRSHCVEGMYNNCSTIQI